MLSVGLTGGIATGKSLVSGIFKELGAYIIDADIISRNLVEPGQPAYREIIDFFGSDILNNDKSINREKLGSLVFADHSLKKKLEEIVHPRVIEEQRKLIRQISLGDSTAIIIIDAPLLIESGFHQEVEILIVVTASDKTVVERLFRRNGLSEEEARLRISSQMPIEEKEEMADYIIDNNGELEKTRRRVVEIMETLAMTAKSKGGD
ncbi:MAG: dephospho-CoA kinase [Nitrospinota bacterium]